MIPTLSANSLKPLFAPPKKTEPPKADDTAYNLLKAAVTHSSISKFAITGGMLGWFSGQSYELAAVGGIVGFARDCIPILFNELPDDIKELATQTANIGLTTLGTYAIYHTIPNSWVRAVFSCIPLSVKRLPETIKALANSPISTPETPRTFEALVKEALKFISPLIGLSAPLIRGTLKTIGFGDFRKFTISAASSYIGLESLKAIGEHKSIRPFSDIVKEFANNKAQFADKLFNVGVAISAIPLSTYLHKNPIQPLNLSKSPDLTLPFGSRLLDVSQYWAGHAVNTLLSTETYSRALIIGSLFVAHTLANYNKPVASNKEIDAVRELTLDDIYDLLLDMMEGNQTVKAKNPTFSNRFDKLQATIAPIREKLDRAVKEGHIANQTIHRDAILAVLDREIADLTAQLNPIAPAPHLGEKSKALLQMFMIETLNIKLEELSYQDNDKAHRGIHGQRARVKAVIRLALQTKFEMLTALEMTTINAANLLDNPSERTRRNSLRALADLIERNRNDTVNAINDL